MGLKLNDAKYVEMIIEALYDPCGVDLKENIFPLFKERYGQWQNDMQRIREERINPYRQDKSLVEAHRWKREELATRAMISKTDQFKTSELEGFAGPPTFFHQLLWPDELNDALVEWMNKYFLIQCEVEDPTEDPTDFWVVSLAETALNDWLDDPTAKWKPDVEHEPYVRKANQKGEPADSTKYGADLSNLERDVRWFVLRHAKGMKYADILKSDPRWRALEDSAVSRAYKNTCERVQLVMRTGDLSSYFFAGLQKNAQIVTKT